MTEAELRFLTIVPRELRRLNENLEKFIELYNNSINNQNSKQNDTGRKS